LPSIDIGNLLCDFIHYGAQENKKIVVNDQIIDIIPENKTTNGIIPLIKLTHIYRCMDKDLNNVFKCILDKKILGLKKSSKNYVYINGENNFNKYIKSLSEKDMRNMMILCPSNKGDKGATEINKKVKREIFKNGFGYSRGERIICTKNNKYGKDEKNKKQIYNGNIYYIEDINIDKREYKINNDENDKHTLGPNDMKYFKYAWAITIHKAQGKEWDKVVVILPSENMCMMNNSILYTAITRSKKECILISDHTTLKRSISVDYKKPNTMLSIKN
jgi:exodeoxyribonuclease V alpha subunit